MLQLKTLLCFCLVILFSVSYAQDGSPDLSFGNNGYIAYDPTGEEHQISGAIETIEGNIFTLINSYSTNNIPRIHAFTPEGLPLLDFGVNGVLEITGPITYYDGINQFNQGGFILHGTGSNNQLIISKHFEDGSLDLNFGDNGYLYPFINGGNGSHVRVTGENHVLVSGNQIISGVHHVVMKRFTENGLQDDAFGINGQVLFPVNGSSNLIVRSLILQDDYYYSGINYNDASQGYKSIIRSDSDGNIDIDFGTDGLLQIPIESEFFTNFNVFQDGTILIGGGYWDHISETHIRKTIKINSEGEVIQSFGNNGAINGHTGEYIQSNQRFISNRSFIDWEGGVNPIYSRFFSSGTLDNSFQFNTNYQDVLGSVTMLHLQNGKFMLISSDIWYNWPDIKITLQRFNNSPLHITDFNKSNITVYPNPSNGIFQIQSETNFYNGSFEIFDSLGKKVLSGHIKENDSFIDLTKADSGVYFLKIAENSQTIKLIKK